MSCLENDKIWDTIREMAEDMDIVENIMFMDLEDALDYVHKECYLRFKV